MEMLMIIIEKRIETMSMEYDKTRLNRFTLHYVKLKHQL